MPFKNFPAFPFRKIVFVSKFLFFQLKRVVYFNLGKTMQMKKDKLLNCSKS